MSTLPAFLMFALVAGFTPGPNNLMLATSGMNFGFRRTLPHLLGVIFGYPVLFAATGAGLGSLFTRFPFLHTALMVLGAAYLLWLAWRIAFAPATIRHAGDARPLGFWQAAAFQWINPKGWMMAITAISLYTQAGPHYLEQIAWMSVIAWLVTLCSTSTWALFGVGIRRLLDHHPQVLRAFNIGMGLLLVLSLLPMLFSEHLGL